MKQASFILLVLFLILIISCDTAYYKESHSFDGQVWSYDDPRSFDFDITDTTKVYDMTLTVNHTDIFPYQNLYLQTATRFPSDTTRTQLLSLEFANEAGFWYGECNGANCQISIPIQSGVHFQEIGNYQLELAQHTRTNALMGVSSIVLRLEALQ